MGHHVAAGRADFHAGFPGLALAECGRGAEAGRQQSSAVHSDRRVQNRRRPHQHRRQRPEDVGATVPRHRCSGASRRPAIHHCGQALRRIATCSTAEIERHLASADSATWIERLNAAGVPCGRIYSVDQVFADPQVEQLKMVDEIESPHYHPLKVVAQAVRLSRTPHELRRGRRNAGEHTDEILGSLGSRRRKSPICAAGKSYERGQNTFNHGRGDRDAHIQQSRAPQCDVARHVAGRDAPCWSSSNRTPRCA